MMDGVWGSLIGAAVGLGLSALIFCGLMPWWINRGIGGALRCRLRWHRWTRWEPYDRFIDTSYGIHVPMLHYRSECVRCGFPRRQSVTDLSDD